MEGDTCPTRFLEKMNLFGETWLILSKAGVKLHTRGTSLCFVSHTILTLFRPEKDSEKNTEFNYYVSKVWIRSEHCVGFLKGCWSSLRGL